MSSTKVVYRMIRGQLRPVDEQVLRWRKRMARFKRDKSLLSKLLIEFFKTPEAAKVFLETPQEELGNAKPKQFITPGQIKGLIKWVKSRLGIK